MIIALLLGIISLILLVVSSILSLFSFAIPDQIGTALTTFLSYLQYANFAIPILTLVSAAQYFLIFLAIWYTMKLAFWVLSSLPFFKNFGPPKISEGSSEITHSRAKDNSIITKIKSKTKRSR